MRAPGGSKSVTLTGITYYKMSRRELSLFLLEVLVVAHAGNPKVQGAVHGNLAGAGAGAGVFGPAQAPAPP